MIAKTIEFLLVNFTLTLFVVGLIASGVRIARNRHERPPGLVSGALLDWFLFFSIGVAYTWNFVVHSVFGDFSAKVIGWPQSPFQLEVAFASLGFALIGFLAFSRRADLRVKLAAVLGVTAFLWGAAGGHVYQLLAHGNHAAGNSGVILWTDILLPVFGLAAVYAHHRALARRAEGERSTPVVAEPRATIPG
ncbi:hypothetical protein LQ327_25725 [Actinomycetospora endophytica]|uniref:Uncharacterized protein n=1 Tax=Actinomycetospora endophytica TaxID=2291215 RepID=A0ABS8PH02_9PSEU|nr:DUF6790 family protein [Actinomycetospora endophytica]MCD2196775.1 hypothetical protein [Actinomycetospora endophytica]